MTARRRLLPANEIRESSDLALEIMAKAKERGLCVGVDIRADGLSIIPKGEETKGTPFDAWKANQQDSDRPTRSAQAPR